MSKVTKRLFSGLRSQWKVILIIALVLITSSTVKMFAASQLGYLGDEPDDFANMSMDSGKVSSFFNDVSSVEQSRLPHFTTMPFVAVAGSDKLFVARLVSLLAFNAFLVVVYFLLRLYLSRDRALFGLIAIASSCYLFSYSFFAATSSNSLYLFLSTLSMYLYLRQTKQGVSKYSTQMAVLGIVFGLAMAAKLFGVILLAIVVLYDVLQRRQWKKLISRRDIKIILRSHQFKSVILFYVVWLAINLLPISLAAKLSLFVVSLPITVGYFILSVVVDKFVLNSFLRWVYITLVAGMVLILASPIYLNVHNVVRIFDWSEEWNSVNVIINPSVFDPFITIGVKFGIVAGILLMVSLVMLIHKRQFMQMLREYGLLFVVFGVFLLIFLLVRNYFAWYPLIVFWILYIPFCYIFPEKIRRNFLTIILALALMAIPAFEVYRYASLFPNGHTDGAQYGAEYVGWNKPGFITFEGLPLLKDYVSSKDFANEKVDAKCVLVPDNQERYESYATATINQYLSQEGVHNFACTNSDVQGDYTYVVTSNYTSQSFIDTLGHNYVRQKDFYINTVNVATFWVKHE